MKRYPASTFFKPSIWGSSLIAVLGILMAMPEGAHAQTFSLKQSIANPDPGAGRNFGFSVAVQDNGDFLAGSPFDDISGLPTLDEGVLRLFNADGAVPPLSIVNPDPSNRSQFGYSVASSGNQFIVGSNLSDISGINNSGAAYLFDSDGSLVRTFLSPNADSGGQFGSEIDFEDDFVLISAPNEQIENVDRAGRAYLFRASTGDLLQTFENPNPSGRTNGDHFGRKIDLSGDNVLIGANLGSQGNNSGAAYLFDANDGSILNTFLSPNAGNNDLFGNDVALGENRVVIGSPQDDDEGKNSGAVYVFNLDRDNSNYQLLDEIFNPSAQRNGQFGFDVELEGDLAAFSAIGQDVSGVRRAGSVLTYDFATDTFLQTIENPEPSGNETFGEELDLLGDTLLVGAPVDSNNAGSVYQYELEGSSGDLVDLGSEQPPEFGTTFPKLFQFGARAGVLGSGDFELVLDGNGLQSPSTNSQTAEFVWQNGEEVPWELLFDLDNQIATFVFGEEQITYNTGFSPETDFPFDRFVVALSAKNGGRVGSLLDPESEICFGFDDITLVDGSAPGFTPYSDCANLLAGSELVTRAFELQGSSSSLASLSGTVSLSWDDTNPQAVNARSRLAVQFLGFDTPLGGGVTGAETVPEPSGLAFLFALSGVGYWQRRSRRK
ncbi:MAG: FG-GAP repeat protein [Cyanobacteria bacterium P01_H01_bin.15]